MGSVSSHAAPVMIASGGCPSALRQVSLGTSDHSGDQREAFIQKLVYDHPEIIPMAEIAPPLMPLVSYAWSFPPPPALSTTSGSRPKAGSCWGSASCFATRRPAARSLSRLWTTRARSPVLHYEEFEAAVRKALGSTSTTLWSLVREHSALDEAQFIDAVSRRLRRSHFMILVIGDGIQEGVESSPVTFSCTRVCMLRSLSSTCRFGATARIDC